jgi:hypothetical protein
MEGCGGWPHKVPNKNPVLGGYAAETLQKMVEGLKR